jgi:hypothetical protein
MPHQLDQAARRFHATIRKVMSDSPQQPQTQDTSQQGELDEQRQEHLAALGKNTEDLPDMTDPQEWQDAPKEGGGA